MAQTPPAGWYEDPENQGRKRWWDGQAWGPDAVANRQGGRLAALMTAVGAAILGSLFYGLNHSAVGEKLCGSDIFSSVSHYVCKAEYERVSNTEASDFVDTWLATGNGSQRANQLFALTVHDDVTLRDVEDTWTTVIRGERVGSVTRLQGTNQFLVPVRLYTLPADRISQPEFYAGPLLMYDKDLTFSLVHTQDGVRARSLGLSNNDPLGEDPQRHVQAVAKSDFYHTPNRVPDGASNLGPHSNVWEICQLHIDGQAESWWAATYLGWVPHADLMGGDVEVVDLPTCVYHPRP